MLISIGHFKDFADIPWEDTPDFHKPAQRKKLQKETFGEGSGLSSRGMWVRSWIIDFSYSIKDLDGFSMNGTSNTT